MKKYVLVFLIVLLIWGVLYVTIGEDDSLLYSQQVNVKEKRILRDIKRMLYLGEAGIVTVTEPEETLESKYLINLEPLNIEKHISILSVGDIMAHTIQFEAARRDDGYDFYPQLEFMTEKISSKDFAIGNLETVFAGEDARYSGKNMIFNTPDNLGESIKKAGFDILTTANNHALDRGYFGINRTLETLDTLDILHTGTNRTEDESEDILIFEKDHVKFALLSYSFSTNGWPMPEGYPYALNMMDEDKIISDIQKCKALDVDFTMVAVHWGLEYHLEENGHQRRLADALFYAGADIILGTHPHVLQPFEHQKMIDVSGEVKDKFIIYSQGNFLSGQRTYPRAIGMYINFDVVKVGIDPPYVNEVSVMPTYVESSYKNGQRYMRVFDVHEAQMKYLDNEWDISQNLNEQLKDYEATFVEHLFSRVEMTPYLNESNEYVIYKK